MKVAWHEVPGTGPSTDSVPERRCDPVGGLVSLLQSKGANGPAESHRTLRDGPHGHVFQAINCLATFIQSLRDKRRVAHSLPIKRLYQRKFAFVRSLHTAPCAP
jgi:hypothetical protein